MLRFLMPTEIHLALEGSSTQITRKRFEPGVFPGMRDQIRRLTERLSTHGAFMWFFTCEINKKKAFYYTEKIFSSLEGM